MISFIMVLPLEKSIKSLFIISLILISRKKLKYESFNSANMILWSILFLYLLFPYSILISVENIELYGIFKYLLKCKMVLDKNIWDFVNSLGTIFINIYQLIIALLLIIYLIFQIVQRDSVLKDSVSIGYDSRIQSIISSFRLKRKVVVLINDYINTPITYGVFHPKIILQSSILQDGELLEFVLTHELTHVKNYDMIFNHLKNLINCMYWYNIALIVSSKYIEDDIETLCDKLVVERLGDSNTTRKKYCLGMLKLIESKSFKKTIALNMHPTKERMVTMKKWRKNVRGVCTFALVMILSLTTFVDVRASQNSSVVSSVLSSYNTINENHRVKEISNAEYNKLNLDEVAMIGLRSANINSMVTLNGLEDRSYKFNLYSSSGYSHDGFTVKVSDLECKNGPNYAIIIKENGEEIYNSNFSRSTSLAVKVHANSRFEVIINNLSSNTLTYRIRINSYKR